MADVKLNSLKFPNLPDRYILDADKVNYSDSETYADGSVGKALQNKAEVDGSYESMTVGNAEQLVSNVRVNDKTPYLFRTSGGSVDIGDREYVNGIVGGTVAWNQLLKNANFASGMQNWSVGSNATASVSNGVLTAVANGTPTGNQYVTQGGLAIPSGHKMLWSAEIASNNAQIAVQGVQSSPWTNVFVQSVSVTSTLTPKAGVVAVGSGNTVNGFFFNFDQKENVIIKSPQLFDLTQMFGSTIADYIYSLETANAGAGVAWFKKLFNKPYYAYNAGELKSVSGLVSHDMTGFNQWDEEWELGGIDVSTGINITDSTVIRSKNYISVIPNTTYYLKSGTAGTFNYRFYDAEKNYISGSYLSANNTLNIPSGVYYMRFVMGSSYGTTYKNDICINISWDGSRDGEYEEYELHSYPLDSDLTLRGIPKLDANNNLYYDGDTYEADGTVTRRYGTRVIDGNSTFVWINNSNNAYVEVRGCKRSTDYRGRLICNNLETVPAASDSASYPTIPRWIGAYPANSTYPNNNWIYWHVDGITTSADMTTWLASNPITVVYEFATPTTESADPYQQVEIVSDFGTEEFVIDDNTFAVPVGTDTEYPIDLRAKLEMAPNSPSDGDGDYIVRQTNGVNEYVPLVIEDALPTIPSTAGTYTLTVTVADGVDPILSWEAE